MAFGVRKFPNSEDPRNVTFNSLGFDDESTPPYQWRLQTTGASDVWAILNDGLPLPFVSGGNNSADFGFPPFGPHSISIILNSDGWLVEDTPLPPFTHAFSGVISSIGKGTGTFSLFQTLPYAIALQGPIAKGFDGTLAGFIPNDVYLVPAAWNFSP